MIDLGHVSAPEVTVWPHRRSHPRHRLSAAVATGVLLLVGAAATPRSDPMPFVTSLPIGPSTRMVMVGDRVVALDESGGEARIRAYGLPDGGLRWTARVTGDTDAARIFARGSTIVVDARPLDASAHTVAGFDAATGRELWHLTAHETMGGAADLLVWLSEAGSFVDGPSQFERVDTLTGRVMWTASLDNGCQTAWGLSAGFIELCDGGYALSVLDLATGRVRAHRLLDAAAGTRHGPLGSGIELSGDVIVVSTDRGSDVKVTAFRARDLAPMWTLVEVQATMMSDNCEPRVCLETPQGTVTLDARTGVEVPPVNAVQRNTIALHPATGVLEFVIVPAARMANPIMAPFDVSAMSVTQEGDEFVIGDYSPGNGVTTWITQQLNDGSYRPVGPLHGVGSSCGFVLDYTVCTTGPARLSLWRLPPMS